MTIGRMGLLLIALLAFPGLGQTETSSVANGGDTFVIGETVTQTLDSAGDVFVAGRSTTVLGRTEGDFHASGFDVVANSNVSQDAYLAGATVSFEGSVGQDLSAAGFTVRTAAASRVARNARLAGATVVVDGPVGGALTVAARDVVLNAAISGDVRILARTLTFGPSAKIAGTLTYSSESEMNVPESVVPSSRVTFQQVSTPRLWQEWQSMQDMHVGPSTSTVLFGFFVTLLFFVLLGALALGFFPKKVSWLRKSIGAAPGRTLLQGIVGLSVLFGAVPVLGFTIIGLPFVPFALLCLLVVWTLAYALGAYAVAMRLWIGLGGETDPSMAIRLAVYAAAIIAISLLNYIPFVGWVANYTLVLLGVGAMSHAVFLALVQDPDPALDADMKPVDENAGTG